MYKGEMKNDGEFYVFTVWSPELKHCTSFGATMQEAIKNNEWSDRI